MTKSNLAEIELYDCTLREGEQTAGARLKLASRLELFSRLDDFGLDYIELGWPMVSEDIANSFKLCKKLKKNSKISAFGSTSMSSDPNIDKNLDGVIRSEADCACIFGKTPRAFVSGQLKISPEENLDKIFKSVEFLKKKMPVFYDAEHFFDAFKEDRDYALRTLLAAAKGGADRLILCDTNGGLLHDEIKKIVAHTRKYLNNNQVFAGLGIHLHNDASVALASTLDAMPYIVQVQGTINGSGERKGNLSLSEFISAWIIKKGKTLRVTKDKLKELYGLYHSACSLLGLPADKKAAYVGEDVFAHKAGAHIDAKIKGLSYEHIDPRLVGNNAHFLMSTFGGASCVLATANCLGYALDKKSPENQEKIKQLFKELNFMEERGYCIEGVEAEKNMLVERYFGNFEYFLKIRGFRSEIEVLDDSEKSRFFLLGKVKGYSSLDLVVNSLANLDFAPEQTNGKEDYELFVDLSSSDSYQFGSRMGVLSDDLLFVGKPVEGGPVDAAYKTMVKLVSKNYPSINDLKIVEFDVRMANENSEESLVRTLIGFEGGDRFETVGVDKNILRSAVEALSKGFNYYLNLRYNPHTKLNNKLNKP